MNIQSIKAIKKGEVAFVKENDASLNTLEANEVLIENKVSHVSLGTEMACLAGTEDWFNFPQVLGYTSIGRILEKSNTIDHLSVGDIVYTYGPHSSHFKIDIHDRWHGICEPVPNGIDLQKAAFTHMAGIAITALRKSDIALGDWVAITGMGAIGNLCAQLCQLQGAKVIGVDINDSRLLKAKDCNINFIVNSAKEDLELSINEITQGQKVSTFIDATGVSSVIMQAPKFMNMYGKLILLGSPRSAYQANVTDFFQSVHLQSHGAIEVTGALEFTLPTHRSEFHRFSIAQNAESILELIANERLNIESLITKVAKPKEAPEIYSQLQENPQSQLGVLFDWNS